MRCFELALLLLLAFAAINISAENTKLPFKRRLNDLRSWNDDGLVAFDDNILEQYIFVSPRNYSLFLFLGASEQQCLPCRQVEVILETVSSTYKKSLPGETFNTSSIFFGRVHYDDAHYAFQTLGVKAVPALLYIKPGAAEGASALSVERYNMKDLTSLRAQELADWVSRAAGLPPMIVPAENDPADFMKYFLIAVILVIFCQLGAVLWRRRKDPIMWYYIAMAVIFIVYAGTVFNAIHSPPPFYIHPRTGQLMLLYPNMRQQFILEGLIIAALICSASGLWVALTVWCPEISRADDRRKAFLLCGGGLVLVLNLLFKFFSLKNYGYPFRFYLI